MEEKILKFKKYTGDFSQGERLHEQRFFLAKNRWDDVYLQCQLKNAIFNKAKIQNFIDKSPHPTSFDDLNINQRMQDQIQEELKNVIASLEEVKNENDGLKQKMNKDQANNQASMESLQV